MAELRGDELGMNIHPIYFSHPRTTMRKSKKDLETADGLNTDIQLKQQAIAYLTAGDYITLGKQLDLHILSHILLQFGITNKLVKYFGLGVESSDGVPRVFQGVDRKGLASTCKKLCPSHSLLP